MIATDYKINHQLEDTVVYFVEAQTGKKGFLITKKIVYLQSFKQGQILLLETTNFK